MTSKNKFWKQWLFANILWSTLITTLFIIGIVSIGSIIAPFTLCIHFYLFKYRSKIVFEKNFIEYRFSDNFMWAGSFFILLSIMLCYSLEFGILSGLLGSLLYGWFTGKRILKKVKQQYT